MYCTDVGAEARGVCIFGNGDENFDVVCGTAAFELGFGLLNVRISILVPQGSGEILP